jgi:hypothetical protein
VDTHEPGSLGRRVSSPLLRGMVGLLVAHTLALPPSLRAQETRVVSGVVEDAESGAPVSEALVTIRGTGLSVVTDPEGRFELSGVPVGSLELVLRHVAYGEQAEALVVEASGSLDFRIRVSSRAIELEPLGVEVPSREAMAQRASGTANNVIDRATIEAFPPGGQGLLPLLQSRIPSLRVLGSCVEYRFMQHATFPDPANPELVFTVPCRDITVYLNGAPYPQGSALLEQLSPEAVERIQVLSPAEAGLQYAAGSRGVILVEMRQGMVTEAPYRIHVNGFGWDEPQSYPWLRVLGVSALGNAVVVGIASRTLLDCRGSGDLPELTRCHDTAGVTAALLTGAMGPLITRWAGRTAYSEGRTYPTLLMAAATASIGYMLYVRGETQGSDTSRAAGQIVLAVGVPLTLTLSNRVFRMLR